MKEEISLSKLNNINDTLFSDNIKENNVYLQKKMIQNIKKRKKEKKIKKTMK